MRPLILVLLLWITCLASAEAAIVSAAPVDTLLVEPAEGARIEASAGSPISLVFTIENPTDHAHVIEGRAELPDGWRVLIPPAPIRIAAGGSHAVILSVSVPRSAQAGDFPVRFEAAAEDDPTAAGCAEIVVSVKLRKGVELVVVETPEFVPAGEKASIGVRVTNTGNTAGRMRVSMSMDGAELTTSSTGLLEGGTSVIVPITATFPENASGVVTLRAEAHGDPTVTARRTLALPIVPQSRPRAGYHNVPAEVQLRLPGHGIAPYPQLVLSGAGRLFDAGEEHVEVFVRTPTQHSVGIYGRPDVYRAAYRSDMVNVLLGDQIYYLSPLSTSGGSFFGAQTETHVGSVDVGGLVNRSRRQFFDQGQQALYARYGSPETGQGALHVLNRTGVDAGQIATARGVRHVHPLLHVDAEAGMGWMETEHGTARRARIEGTSERIKYAVHHESAGLAYPSPQRGRDVNSARLTWQPRSRFQFYGRYYGSSSEYPQAEEASSIYRQSRIRMGSRFRDTAGDLRVRFGASAERVGRRSSSVETSLRGRSLAVRAEAGLGYRAYGIQTTAELGSLRDDWIEGRRPFGEYSLQASFQPSSNQGYNLFLHYFSGARMYAPADYRNLTLNISTYYRPTSRTTLRIRSSAGLSRLASWQEGFLVQADVEHRLPNGHEIEISALGQQAMGSDIRHGLFLLSYTVPLRVPLTASRVDGQLTGRVVDSETGIGRANVRVLLGDRIALTNRDGTFTFAGLDPGTHRLSISRADLGLDAVPAVPLPMDVTLRSGERRTIRLDVSEAASIEGRVELFAPATEGRLSADTTLIPRGGLRNVVVELVRDSLRVRQITDHSGAFRFVGLAAGEWLLSISSASLPPEHTARPARHAVDLHPGEHEKVVIDVVPQPRRIRFMPQEEND